MEAVWDTVPGDGHRPAVPSDDHYEGSTRGNLPSLITFSSRNHGLRVHTPCARFRASVTPRTHIYTVTSHAVRWRKSKSLGRLKASHGDPLDWSSSHVSLKSLHGANRRRNPPILSLLFFSRPRFGRGGTRRNRAREGPPRSRESSFT